MNTYLLSIKELKEASLDSELYREALEKVDSSRREKVMRLTNDPKKVSLGAGLLLQYAVQEYELKNSQVVRCMQISEILNKLSQPQEFTYTYGQNGKPYFTNLPICFNLSHSGDYVLCVVSDTEVGAAIQQMNDIDYWKTAERFFQSEEISMMRKLSTEAEQKRCFYRLWTRKEAYGKFTGDGVAKALSVDMADFPKGTMWEEYEIKDEYCIAICLKK